MNHIILGCGSHKFVHVMHPNRETLKLITNVCGMLVHFTLQECKRRGLKVVVAGIPKTIDNDIEVSSRCAHWCNLRFSTLLLVVSTWQICYKLGNPMFERSCSFQTTENFECIYVLASGKRLGCASY
jgi:hypothetical protein